MDMLQLFQAILHIDRTMGTLIAQYGTEFYFVLFAIVFCETAFLPLFFLPGDPLLFICGAFSATGAVNIWLLMATLFVSAYSGCTVNYGIGRAVGRRAFTHGYRWLNRDALTKTHAFYEKYGGVTLIMSPFLAVIRTFSPFVAGVSAMGFAKFQMFTALGATAWVAILVVGGNVFGNIPFIREHLNAIVLSGTVFGLVALLIGTGWKIRKRWLVKS